MNKCNISQLHLFYISQRVLESLLLLLLLFLVIIVIVSRIINKAINFSRQTIIVTWLFIFSSFVWPELSPNKLLFPSSSRIYFTCHIFNKSLRFLCFSLLLICLDLLVIRGWSTNWIIKNLLSLSLSNPMNVFAYLVIYFQRRERRTSQQPN